MMDGGHNKQVGGAEMRELAEVLKDTLPGLGFALFVFELDHPGIGNYISNCERENTITAIEEVLARLKAGQDFITPETN